MPVIEEKHKHNYVTMVKNVEGDRNRLLVELRNYIGAGGHLSKGDPNGVEIQGQHLHKVEDFLVMRGCLVNVSAAGAAAAAARVGDQTLDDGANKKMMGGLKKGSEKEAKKAAKKEKAALKDQAPVVEAPPDYSAALRRLIKVGGIDESSEKWRRELPKADTMAKTELHLVSSVGDFVAADSVLLKQLPFALKALYDAELCEEATLQYWHEHVASPQMKQSASELMQWFQVVETA
jgi:hypothetical protein